MRAVLSALALAAALGARAAAAPALTSEGLHDRKVVLRGHTSDVAAVAFSPDGRRLVSAGLDRRVLVWKVEIQETASRLASLDGHESEVYAAVFSPNGKTIATGGYDKTIRLWDARTGRQKRLIALNTTAVFSLAYAPDGRTLAAGGDDGLVRFFDAEGSTAAASLRAAGSVRALGYSKDGLLAAGCDDGRVRLWDLRRSRPLMILDAHTDAVSAVAFSPDGKTLATGGRDGLVRLWDAATGAQTAAFTHLDAVTSLAWLSPKALASGGGDAVRFWDVTTGIELQLLAAPDDQALSLSISPDGTTLASGHPDGSVRLHLLQGADEARAKAAPKPVVREQRRI